MKIPARWTVLLAGAALQLFISQAVSPVATAGGATGDSRAPTGELRDIKGLLPANRLFPLLVPGGVAIILAGTIMAFVIVRRRSRRGEPLPESVHLSPDAALDLLERRFRERPEDNSILYQDLSCLLRVCLEQRTGLPVPRMTTEELMAAAAVMGDSPPDQADSLRVVLHRCDLVKFAGYRPSAPETEATLAAVRSIICTTSASAPHDLH